MNKPQPNHSLRRPQRGKRIRFAIHSLPILLGLLIAGDAPAQNPPGGAVANPGEPNEEVGEIERPVRPATIIRGDDRPGETYTANHVQGPMLTDILPRYEELIKKKIIVDSTITDAVTMTIKTQQEMSREEAIRFYTDSFLINGYAILGVNDTTVKFVAVATRPVGDQGKMPIYLNIDDIPDTDDIVAYMMKFENIPAEEASRVFQLFTRSTTGGYIPAPDGATLIVTASGRVIRDLAIIKKQIDVPRGNLRQEAIQLERASAEEVSSSLNEILTNATSSRQRSGGTNNTVRLPALATTAASRAAAAEAARAPATAAARGEISALPDANSVHIHPIIRTNSVLVIARPVDFAYIKGLVEIFDAPNVIDNFLKRELRYLPVFDFLPLAENALLRYQDGANAAQGGGSSSARGGTNNRSSGLSANNRNSTRSNNTNSNFGNSRTGGSGGSSFGGGAGLSGSGGELGAPDSLLIGNTILIADPQLNNIIVSGPPEHLRIIDQLLDEVDVRPRRVYISAVIAQVELGDDLRYGMDILRTVDDINVGGEDVNIAGLFRTTTGGGTILDPTTLATVADFDQGLDGFSAWASIGNFLNTYVEALENTRRFTVISRPFVFTGNNQVASINSGQRVAVPTSTTSSLNSTDTINSSIGFEEVLLQLEVLPLINSSDEVTLEIAQQNENIASFTQISGNQVPNISTQSLNTKVSIPNRGIVVLGGIIQEEDRDNVNGLPIISKVPLLKRLTGSTNKQKQRRELLIFLQPHIIEGSTDLIDANIEKVSPTIIGEDALELGKPQPEVDNSLFPEYENRRRLFKRGDRNGPMGSGDEESYLEEPALPQWEEPRRPSAAAPAARKEEPTVKKQDPPEADRPRKRLLFGRKARKEELKPSPAREEKSSRKGILRLLK